MCRYISSIAYVLLISYLSPQTSSCMKQFPSDSVWNKLGYPKTANSPSSKSDSIPASEAIIAILEGLDGANNEVETDTYGDKYLLRRRRAKPEIPNLDDDDGGLHEPNDRFGRRILAKNESEVNGTRLTIKELNKEYFDSKFYFENPGATRPPASKPAAGTKAAAGDAGAPSGSTEAGGVTGATDAVGSGAVTDAGGDAVTDAVGDGVTDAAGDGVTDAAGDGVTDAAGDGVTDAAGDGVTDAAGDGVTDAAGDGVTDAADDGVTDAGGEAGDEAVTDAGGATDETTEGEDEEESTPSP